MKEQIVVVSIKLFEKKGFSSTSIQDIVDKIGVTKGTFYYYFKTKEQLLMDIHYNYITYLLERQKRIFENKSLSPKEKLIKYIHLINNDIVEHGPSARVLYRELRNLSTKNMEEITQIRREIRKNVEEIIQEGIVQGDFKKSLKVDMVTFGIIGMTNWSYNWYDSDGELTPDELSTIYSDLILYGIVN